MEPVFLLSIVSHCFLCGVLGGITFVLQGCDDGFAPAFFKNQIECGGGPKSDVDHGEWYFERKCGVTCTNYESNKDGECDAGCLLRKEPECANDVDCVGVVSEGYCWSNGAVGSCKTGSEFVPAEEYSCISVKRRKDARITGQWAYEQKRMLLTRSKGDRDPHAGELCPLVATAWVFGKPHRWHVPLFCHERPPTTTTTTGVLLNFLKFTDGPKVEVNPVPSVIFKKVYSADGETDLGWDFTIEGGHLSFTWRVVDTGSVTTTWLPYIAKEVVNVDAYGTRIYTPDRLKMEHDGTGDWTLVVEPGKIEGSIRPSDFSGSYSGEANIFHTYIHSLFPDPWSGFQLTIVFKFSFAWKGALPSAPKIEGFTPEFGPCEMGMCLTSCTEGICLTRSR